MYNYYASLTSILFLSFSQAFANDISFEMGGSSLSEDVVFSEEVSSDTATFGQTSYGTHPFADRNNGVNSVHAGIDLDTYNGWNLGIAVSRTSFKYRTALGATAKNQLATIDADTITQQSIIDTSTVEADIKAAHEQIASNNADKTAITNAHRRGDTGTGLKVHVSKDMFAVGSGFIAYAGGNVRYQDLKYSSNEIFTAEAGLRHKHFKAGIEGNEDFANVTASMLF